MDDADAATLRALAGLGSTSAALKTRIAGKLEAQATPPKPQAAARKAQNEVGNINKTIEKQNAVVAASQEAATEALRSIADGESRLNELEAELLAATHAATHALQQLAG